eukprot:5626111-Alexandrium_andersonii.AAC.1
MQTCTVPLAFGVVVCGFEPRLSQTRTSARTPETGTAARAHAPPSMGKLSEALRFFPGTLPRGRVQTGPSSTSPSHYRGIGV